MPEPRTIPWLRLAAIIAVGTYVQIGPVRTQLLSLQRLPYFKTWMMYRSFGRDICRVQFYEGPRDDRMARDRFEVLSETWESGPEHIRFIPNVAQVARTGRFMCRHMKPETVLSVTGECGSNFAWRPLEQLADINLCALSEEQLLELGPKMQTKKKRRKAKAGRP